MELINFPTTSPMIAVGTYSTVTDLPSKGYSVNFDKLGRGQIFSASGSMIASMTNDVNVLVLSPGVNVQMNSITQTNQAVTSVEAYRPNPTNEAPSKSNITP
ncbi:hypothetical protein EC991_006140 [Linnemannia zychae]|nr:hypothetical protein EC991_006140 [Linnemannia zychae]